MINVMVIAMMKETHRTQPWQSLIGVGWRKCGMGTVVDE